MHNPPGNLKDFDHGQNPGDLYRRWHDKIADDVQNDPSQPAWYDSLNPPAAGNPAQAAPPWQGMPRMALVLNHQDVLAAATAVDQPVEFGSGLDALLVTQPDFLNAAHHPVKGFYYREEFRTPLGVRKSPKNEPAVNSRMFMGIAEISRAWLGGGDGFDVDQTRHPGGFGGGEGRNSAASALLNRRRKPYRSC
jgi:hypothetical protein